VTSAGAPFRPHFIDGAAGRLFTIHHPPRGSHDRGDVLYLPPFAEEMNCARRMAALQARALADAGFGVLLLDPYGCGDSAGDIDDATWAIWRDDALAAAHWLGRDGPRPLTLLGLRLGGLLALDLAAAHPGLAERAVLWQPVVNGATFLTRFLRLRVAAAMAGSKAETTKDLRARFKAGETLEIAGYALSPDLAAAIDGLRLAPLGAKAGLPIHWFELAGEADRPLPPASARAIDAWRDAGLGIGVETICGDPFWAIQETTLAPALIAATTRALVGT